MTKKISLLGCGWLGLPLGKNLVEKGFEVRGSTTSPTKISLLEQQRIFPFLITLKNDKIDGEIKDFFYDSEVLIINIPPKLRSNTNENFVNKIHNLIPFIEQSVIRKVLFISSTSVYGNQKGIVTEKNPLLYDTESGRQLAIVEELLQSNTTFQTTIVRFGGLVGFDRNPIQFLAGRKNLSNGKNIINFIHQTDCINIITSIINHAKSHEVWNRIFNAVAPNHTTRETYYNRKALEFQLIPPIFETQQQGNEKIICSRKLITALNYTFVEEP